MSLNMLIEPLQYQDVLVKTIIQKTNYNPQNTVRFHSSFFLDRKLLFENLAHRDPWITQSNKASDFEKIAYF